MLKSISTGTIALMERGIYFCNKGRTHCLDRSSCKKDKNLNRLPCGQEDVLMPIRCLSNRYFVLNH